MIGSLNPIKLPQYHHCSRKSNRCQSRAQRADKKDSRMKPLNLQCLSSPSLRLPSLIDKELNGSMWRLSKKDTRLGEWYCLEPDSSRLASNSGAEVFRLIFFAAVSSGSPFSRRALMALVLVLCDHVFNLNLPLYWAGSFSSTLVTTSMIPVMACRFCFRR